MLYSRFLTAAAVFCVAVCAGCSDNSNSALTGPNDPTYPTLPTPPGLSTISGRIAVIGSGDNRIVELQDANGTVYRLVGTETGALASVDGGDVVARGTFDANPGFVVEDFQVIGMFGRAALDGVLEVTDDGFALRLTDGSLRVVPGLSSDCANHIGARMWVIGWDESDVRFGLIAAV